MLRIRVVVASLLMLPSLSCCAEPRKKTLPEAIEFVRPSVVRIAARIDPTPNPSAPIQIPSIPTIVPLGTGFMVNAEGYVITARHVVEALQSLQVPGNKRLVIGVALPNLEDFKSGGASISIRGNFADTECDVVEEDALHDIALLKMKQNPFTGGMGTFMKTPRGSVDYPHKVATLLTERPHDGERIAVSGYPLSKTVMITTSGNLASAWGYETKQVQPPRAPAGSLIPENVDLYLADMHVNPGNSGGPVYSVERGSVIGICVSFQAAPIVYADAGPRDRALYFNSGLSDVVPIRYAIDLLKKNSLNWTEQKNVSDSGSSKKRAD